MEEKDIKLIDTDKKAFIKALIADKDYAELIKNKNYIVLFRRLSAKFADVARDPQMAVGKLSDCLLTVGINFFKDMSKLPTCCFYGLDGYEDLFQVVAGAGVKVIGNMSFAKSGITEADIPSSVTEIGYGAFSDCDNLVSVTIPQSVQSIDDAAFYNCNSLNSVTFDSECAAKLGKDVFAACPKLKSVEIPSSLISNNTEFNDTFGNSEVTVVCNTQEEADNLNTDFSGLSSKPVKIKIKGQ